MITRGTYRNPFTSLRKSFLAAVLSLAALDQDVQYVAVLAHCTPEVMEVSVNLEEHFVEVQAVAGPRRLVAQAVGVSLAELEAPFSDGSRK